MTRIIDWLANRLLEAIRPELEVLRAKQFSYNKNTLQQLSGIGKRLDRVEEQFAGFDVQIGRIEEQFGRVEVQVTASDDQFAKARARLDGISAAVAAMSDASRADLERRLAEQEQIFGSRIEASLTGAKQHIDAALKDERQHIDASVADARQQIGASLADARQHLEALLADTRQHVEALLADARRHIEASLADTRQHSDASLADATQHIDASLADAEKRQREETSGQVRAELAPVSNLMTRHFNWSRDTARMVGEVRAEMRLLTAVADQPAKEENGDSGDPQLLRRYIEKSKIREVYPTELFEGIGEITLPIASINEESGHGNQVDLMYVAAIAKVRGALNIFEFGTFIGRTTYHLTLASEDTRVTTLNLPPTDEAMQESLGRMFRGTDREDHITQLLGDSADFDPTPYAGSMDFVFVDADHSYELVKNDTEKALVMLKPGGVIVWHDYAVKSPGVVTYIQEFAAERPVFRLKHTCLIVYLDGVDAMAFEGHQRAPETVPLTPAPVQLDGSLKQQMRA